MTFPRLSVLALCMAVAAPAAADPLPAPDYFVASAFETSTAQAIALSCSNLSVDPAAVARHSDDVMTALAADGFTAENVSERMADPSGAIATLQAAFLARHDLAEGAPEEAVCAAGRREMAEGSALGALLTEVAP
ncbi:MAG: DUF5333 family protein [Pseudomonadota bacterium]